VLVIPRSELVPSELTTRDAQRYSITIEADERVVDLGVK